MYRLIFHTFTYYKSYFMPMAISMPHENWKLKMKNEKLLEICSALGPRKRRKATEAGSAMAKTSITYNSLNFGQIKKK